MDEVLLALPFILWLQSAAMPLRHPLSRVPLSLQPPHFVAVAGYAALPIGRMSPRENPSLDFPEDRRFALQISGLLSRASMRSLFIGKKGKNMPARKSLLGFFLDCRSQGLLHVANPPSMARYSLARNKSVPCTRSAASSGPSKGTFPKKLL